MAGNDVREAAARVFGLLSNEERRKRRLTTMMDRLREDGWVDPRSTRPAQGPSITDAAQAIETRLGADDTLRAEAERQIAEQTGQSTDGDFAEWPSEGGTDPFTAESRADLLAEAQ